MTPTAPSRSGGERSNTTHRQQTTFTHRLCNRRNLRAHLLQTHQPAEARLPLERALSLQPDPEGFWLLSRAYLQEGAKEESLAAWEKSGSFRDDNPLLPEPSPFVGSNRCAECHSAVFQSQQSSRHAHTFFRVSELGNIALPPPSFPDPGQSTVTHTLKKLSPTQLQQETHVDNQVFVALVEYAFGSGDRGLTLVGPRSTKPSFRAASLTISNRIDFALGRDLGASRAPEQRDSIPGRAAER